MWTDLQHGFVCLKRDAGVSALIILVLALGSAAMRRSSRCSKPPSSTRYPIAMPAA